MKTQLLIDNNLKVHLYYPDAAITTDGTLSVDTMVLFVPGLPQTPNRDIPELMVRRGYACAYLHYYGSWFSKGSFTPAESRKSIKDALQLLKNRTSAIAKGDNAFKWDYKKISVVANSYGAQALLTSDIDFEQFESIELFSPYLLSSETDYKEKNLTQEQEFLKNTLADDLKFLRKGFDAIYSGIERPEWDEYFNGKDSGSTLKSGYPKFKIVSGTKDAFVPLKILEAVKKKYDCDINIIDGVGHDYLKLYAATH
jgi:hypothetical protein